MRGIGVYFEIDNNDKVKNKKNTIICTHIDPRKLSLQQDNKEFIVQDNTKIPIVRYKEKVVVLQNDCGFYDIVHDNACLINYKNYW